MTHLPRTALPSAVLLLITLPFLGACTSESEARSQDPPPPMVSVTTPVEQPVVEWDEFTGRLASVDTVEVRARVTGYVDKVHFDEGALVDAGDPLFTLDPRTFRADLAEVEARREQARVRLELAKTELARIEPLVELRAVSQEELDQRQREVETARAALEAAQAEVETSSLDLGFTRVTAPISGRAGRAMVTEGNLVTGGSGSATVLTTLVSLDPIYLYFTPDERTALKYLRRMQSAERDEAVTVEMQLADETGYPHQGRLDFVDNRVDDETGTLLLRAVFDNPDGTLVPGLFGKVRLQAAPPQPGLWIPEAAISLDQTQEYVLVVDEDNQVGRRVITTGETKDGLRVVRDGLSPEDRIVVEGLQRARPGAQVTPEPANGEADEADVEGAPA